MPGGGEVFVRQIFVLWACGFCLASCAFSDSQGTRTERRRLDKTTEIQGYTCKPGYAWFYDGGALSSCQLEREVAFGEATVPAGSWITISPTGQPDFAFLRDDTRIGAVTCMGSNMGREGVSTSFYPGGRLRACFLAGDQEIQGVPCVHDGFISEVFHGNSVVEFYENGDLHSCRLSRAATVRGQAFDKGERVYLKPSSGAGHAAAVSDE